MPHVRFMHEEVQFVSSQLGAFSKADTRRLLKTGVWTAGIPGDILTRDQRVVDVVAPLIEDDSATFLDLKNFWRCGREGFFGRDISARAHARLGIGNSSRPVALLEDLLASPARASGERACAVGRLADRNCARSVQHNHVRQSNCKPVRLGAA